MIRGKLIVALDFAPRDDVGYGTVTQLRDEHWYVYRYGPKYENAYKITEFDAEGEAWLRAHQGTPGTDREKGMER